MSRLLNHEREQVAPATLALSSEPNEVGGATWFVVTRHAGVTTLYVVVGTLATEVAMHKQDTRQVTRYCFLCLGCSFATARSWYCVPGTKLLVTTTK